MLDPTINEKPFKLSVPVEIEKMLEEVLLRLMDRLIALFEFTSSVYVFVPTVICCVSLVCDFQNRV